MPLSVAAARRFDDLVAFLSKGAAQALQDLLLVISQENRSAERGGRHAVAPGAVCGRSMAISVPEPGMLWTRMVPPSPSMMLREIGNPRPVPARRVVKYGSKMCA